MNRTFSKIINFWGLSLLICSDNPEVILNCEKLIEIAGIPIALTDPIREYHGPIISILDRDDVSINFDAISNALIIEVVWNDISAQTSTLKNLIGQMVSFVCWNNEIYPIHSAAITKNKHTILFLGDSGSGKTNLSYVLSKYKGYKWIGNDWVGLSYSVNAVTIEKGHDLINFSAFGYKQLAKSGFRLNVKDNCLHENNISAWDKTRYFTCDELGIDSGDIPVKVNSIILMDIREIGECSLERVPLNIAATIILKELVWPLRGCGSFVIDNNGYAILPSVSVQPQNGWESACQLTNKLIDTCQIFRLSGSLESIFKEYDHIESEYLKY